MSKPIRPEVWITGAAAVTALGDTLESTCEAMFAGRTAGRWVDIVTSNGRSVRVPAAPVENSLTAGMPLESSCERADCMALAVAHQAVATARLTREQLAPAAVAFGSSKPSIGSWFLQAVLGHKPAEGSPKVVLPNPGSFESPTWDMLTPQRAAVLVADALAVQGPILSSVAACSTGLHTFIRAVQWLRDGDGPIAITGSVESSLNPLFASAFLQMRVLAVDHAEAAHGCRPFDRQRCGFVIGEGAAALVLETAEHARARGAWPLAIVAGYRMGADPTGLAELDALGRPLASAIRRCLANAGVGPDEVACIKAHGTATVQNDVAEAAAIASVFPQLPPVVSFKGYLGHTLGASGAIEMALCTQAVQCGMMPGNANLTSPDPACGGNHPTNPVAIPQGPASHVLCLSAGFGGHLAAVLVRPGRG